MSGAHLHSYRAATQMLVPDTYGQIQTLLGDLQYERESQIQQREKRNSEELGTDEMQNKIKEKVSWMFLERQ